MMRFTYIFRDNPRMLFGSLAALVTLGVYQVGTTTRPFPAPSANSSFAPASVKLVTASVAAPSDAPAQVGTPAVATKMLGINLAKPVYWLHERSFMNLATGGNWASVKPGQWVAMDLQRIDPTGAVKSLEAGETGALNLMPPGPSAEGTWIKCTYAGTGVLTVGGADDIRSVTNNSFEFKWTVIYPEPRNTWLVLRETSPADPVRDIDCREVGASRTKLFADSFLDSVRPFSTLRFLDWQATNDNVPVTWSTRTPANAFVFGTDGVPIEHLIALARETNTDPWFHIPWNADEEYVTRFAKLVHDTLPADRKVYVELSNEVWNWQFRATQQANQEAIAAGLGSGEGFLRRYAQKSTWAFKIWTRIFADRPGQLVRVVATQHYNPYFAEVIFSYRDTAQYTDALATAPYFGFDLLSEVPANASPDEYLLQLGLDADRSFEATDKLKAIASRFGKRYIAYESGQHIVTNDIETQRMIQRHPKMYDVYRRYFRTWNQKVGDLMMVFASTGPIAQYGSWGIREYAGQPLAETPKRRAALDFIANPNN